MKKPLHPVTDHAVIRYLERVIGVDIESIRRKIGRRVDLAAQNGASGAVVDGFVYKLSETGTVVTVMAHSQPEKKTKTRRRKSC